MHKFFDKDTLKFSGICLGLFFGGAVIGTVIGGTSRYWSDDVRIDLPNSGINTKSEFCDLISAFNSQSLSIFDRFSGQQQPHHQFDKQICVDQLKQINKIQQGI